jgi:hypothetical protein
LDLQRWNDLKRLAQVLQLLNEPLASNEHGIIEFLLMARHHTPPSPETLKTAPSTSPVALSTTKSAAFTGCLLCRTPG